jgi:integrase/recombinase XerD
MEMPKRVKAFVNHVEQVESKSSGTANGYGFDICLFFRWLLKERNNLNTSIDNIDISNVDDDLIKTITTDEVEMFVGYIDKERNNAKTTKARKIASLKRFFKYVYKKCRLLNENIAEDLITPKIYRKDPEYVKFEDGMKLLEYILNSDDKHKIRDFTIFYLYLSNGLRLTELVNVDIKHIDFENKSLDIIGKGDKPAKIYLSDESVNVIKTYITDYRNVIKDNIKEEYKDALFISAKSQRISKRTVEDVGKKYMEAIGLDTSKYHIHSIRHGYAMNLYKNGQDIRTIQMLLRHSSIQTTTFYFRAEEEKLREANEGVKFNIGVNR